MKNIYDQWEPVIGLEIHIQLNTKTKLFSSAPNKFGDEPNVNITEVCTGQPGALPVLNKEAIHKAVQFGLAVGATIEKYSRFDRKSYFYPDSPRNFQITQFSKPIITGGKIIADVDGTLKTFEIDRAHLEDDAGMLKHFPEFTGIDYNRAGIPLIEIVSKPVMHSPKEAANYAMAIKAIMQYINASECNMDQGQFRMDANVSVRKKGETTYRTKVEIKNMNSFNFLQIAVEKEILRQIDIYTNNTDENIFKLIRPVTLRFDTQKKENILMRNKETAEDYRYFPEPDIPPIILTEEYVQKIKAKQTELPYDRYTRYIKKLNISPNYASFLVNDKMLSDYFEETTKTCSNIKALCNWIIVEFPGKLKESGQSLLSVGIPPKHLATLVTLIDENVITGKIAKSVADDMIQSPQKDPMLIVKENSNYQPISDSSAIEPLVDEVLKENQSSIEDYKNGKTKAFAFLVGQVMKLTKGKASPQVVNKLLKDKIDTI